LQTAKNFIANNKNYIIIAGAKPIFPDTGLGYIKKGKLIQNDNEIKNLSKLTILKKSQT